MPGTEQKNPHLAELVDYLKDFNSTTVRLEESYQRMQQKVETLNLQLEEKNRELSHQLDEINALKRKFDNVIESMRTGLVAIDLDTNITLFNRAAEEITGYDREQVIGRPYALFFSREEDAGSRDAVATLHSGCAFKDVEDVICRDDRVTIPIKRTTSLVLDDEEQIVGAMELFDDITELKELQRDMQNKYTVEALGDMSRQVAHEIRNPLGGIAGFAALLERDIDKSDPRRRYVQKMIEGIGALDQLVSDLLLYTRPLKPKFRTMDLIKVTAEVLAFARLKYDALNRLQVHQRYAVDRAPARIDQQLYHELVLHMFQAAARKLPSGADLTISIRTEPETRHIMLEFSDNGPVPDPEAAAKLFMPFSNIAGKNNRLELPIVKRIVEIHHGSITTDVTYQRGTRIIIRLPLKTDVDTG